MSVSLVGLLLLGACNALPTGAKKPTTKSSVKPAATGSAKPGTSPRPSPTPMGPTTMLKGSVSIDAHYIISNNAGALISNAGGGAIALKGGKLISDNGLGIISDNGLGLISDNGLGLISDNGLGLISNNSGSYRIQAADDVPLGTVLPVKGMAVFPISLRTGAVVGKPVFTDEQGAYTLNVPESVKGSLRIIARVPVENATDPIAKDARAQYNLVIDSADAEDALKAAIDEDTSVGTRYLRAAFSTRLTELMLAEDANDAAARLVKALGFNEGIKQFLASTVVEINKAAADAGLKTAPPERVTLVAERLTDILISYVKVYEIEIDPIKYGKQGPKEQAFPGMVDVIRHVREAATEALKKDPHAFDSQDWMKDAEYPREIKKPTDMCDFVVDNCLISLNGKLAKTEVVFTNVGVPDAQVQASRLNALAIGVLANIGQTLLTEADAKKAMLDTIKASAKK